MLDFVVTLGTWQLILLLLLFSGIVYVFAFKKSKKALNDIDFFIDTSSFIISIVIFYFIITYSPKFKSITDNPEMLLTIVTGIMLCLAIISVFRKVHNFIISKFLKKDETN